MWRKGWRRFTTTRCYTVPRYGAKHGTKVAQKDTENKILKTNHLERLFTNE